MYEKNEVLKGTFRCVSFIDFCRKGLKLPRFSDAYNANWKKSNASDQGIFSVLNGMDKNIHFAENMEVEVVTNRNSVSKALRDRVPHCICYSCSSRNKDGFPLLKYFPNSQGFIEHCRNHDDTIPAFSFINMELDRES